jgi:hypothetical protein
MHHPHVMSAIGVVLPPSDLVSLTGVVIPDADYYAGDADSASGSGGVIRPGDYVQGPAVVCEYLSAGSLQSCISSGAEWLKSDMAKVKVMLDTARVSRVVCSGLHGSWLLLPMEHATDPQSLHFANRHSL